MVVGSVWEAVTADPTLTIIVATLLVLIFGGYIFLRRLLADARRSFQEGRRNR